MQMVTKRSCTSGLNSGAMIQNIVDRSKKAPSSRCWRPSSAACECSTAGRPSWMSSPRTRTCPTPPTGRLARISGKKGERMSTSARWCREERRVRPGHRHRIEHGSTLSTLTHRRPPLVERRASCRGGVSRSSECSAGAEHALTSQLELDLVETTTPPPSSGRVMSIAEVAPADRPGAESRSGCRRMRPVRCR